MQTTINSALWPQFGAAIEVLEKAIVACPDSLWRARLWDTSSDHEMPLEFAEFWFLSYHAIFWLDLYLTGDPEESFAPPAPFDWIEVDRDWVVPEQPYSKADLLDYLSATYRKCHDTLANLSDEQAGRTIEYAWTQGQPASYLELQLYNMRHVQEHAAQLSLFLGQHKIPDSALEAVARAKPGEAQQVQREN